MFGLRPSFEGRVLVEQALEKANILLSHDTGLVFSPSWRQGAPGSRVISVFAVDADQIAGTDTAFAPGKADCLFISGKAGSRLKALFGEDSESTLDVNATDALALVLLHEAGHFHYGDAGDYAKPQPLNIDTLVRDLNEGKSKELRADQFAGDLIRTAQLAAPPRGTDAADLSLALLNASWNLLHSRLIGNFGATGLRLPSAFGDLNDSHPNLELRFLVMQYVVTRSQVALENLKMFLDLRAAGRADRGILFGKPPAETYHLLTPEPVPSK